MFDPPAIPGLEVYRVPRPGCRYVLGVDPAEGNPHSDDSALEVLDVRTGEEVCCLAGKLEPTVFAGHVARVSEWYGWAPVLCERQNHGHAVLLALRQNAPRVRRLEGQDGREGWLTSTLTKAIVYDRCAEAVRNGEVTLHSLATFCQLAALDGNTLRAPEGQHDDRAMAFALANMARPRADPAAPGPQPRAGVSAVERLRKLRHA